MQRTLVAFLAQNGTIDPGTFGTFFEDFERQHLGQLRDELLQNTVRELRLDRPPSASQDRQ